MVQRDPASGGDVSESASFAIGIARDARRASTAFESPLALAAEPEREPPRCRAARARAARVAPVVSATFVNPARASAASAAGPSAARANGTRSAAPIETRIERR